VQGHIVTGGGLITLNSCLYKDFLPSDLPHYLLQNNLTEETFRRWKKANRRSFSIVGCWSRPIFAGGWQESSFNDTEAYNLQTPSLFIDMRFPLKRPTKLLSIKKDLNDCSSIDLRVLARQHCFSGYSLPETLPIEQYPLDTKEFPIFTRHHVIDWNLHPQFPRNRPNRWWIEVNDVNKEGKGSFKEHSIIRNKATNLPVYFERWARIPPYPHQRIKYFAARKLRRNVTDRDCVLIVTGMHFAIVIDRDMSAATALFKDKARMEHLLQHCGGGGAAYVDYLLNSELHDTDTLNLHMNSARSYLDLEGSYGLIQETNSSVPNRMIQSSWQIRRSTHPWKENHSLFCAEDAVTFEFPNLTMDAIPTKMIWSGRGSEPSLSLHRYGEWEIFECSFSKEDLLQIFPTKNRVEIPKYLSLFSKL
jgi:hypothetical protein